MNTEAGAIACPEPPTEPVGYVPMLWRGYDQDKLIIVLEEFIREGWREMHRARRNMRTAIARRDTDAASAEFMEALCRQENLACLVAIRRLARRTRGC